MPDDGVSERVLAQSRDPLASPVHVRSPRQPTLTLCGRTVDRWPPTNRPISEVSPIGCATCRVLRLARLDRAARGVPELCWTYPRILGRISRIRCEQTLDGHRKSRDGYDLHDGEIDPSDAMLVDCVGCGKDAALDEAERDGWQPLRGGSMLDDARGRCPECAAAASA